MNRLILITLIICVLLALIFLPLTEDDIGMLDNNIYIKADKRYSIKPTNLVIGNNVSGGNNNNDTDNGEWSNWLAVPQEAIHANAKTVESYKGMSWRQGQFQANSKTITSSEGLRIYEGKYMVAVGSFYVLGNSSGTNNNGVIGTTIQLKLNNGRIYDCIAGDLKSDKDTDITNRYHKQDKSVVEFIVDLDKLKSNYPNTWWNISKCISNFKEPVVAIRYGKVLNPVS